MSEPLTSDNQPANKPSSLPETLNDGKITFTLTRGHLVIGAAAVLLLSFFLPWVSFWMGTPSGFDLQKGEASLKIFWLIPLMSVVTILVAARAPASIKTVSRITGLIPFGFLLYFGSQMGVDIVRVLAVGAWLSLVSALVLVIAPATRK